MTPTPSANSPSYRVLIVDDNPAIHSDFRKILGGAQESSSRLDEAEAALFGEAPTAPPVTRFLIDSAYQGQEGLEKVEQALREGKPYSLAFIDVRMPPGWDGVETVSRIWSVDPTLQVVICTAYSDYSWDDMRARLGESDSAVILKKPFDNIEAIQLAHALTKKWLLAGESARRQQSVGGDTPAVRGAGRDAFSAMFAACPLAVALQNPDDGRILEVNEGFVELTGHLAHEVRGRAWSELFEAGDASAGRQDLRGGAGRTTESPGDQGAVRCKSGEVRPVTLRRERTVRDGRPIELVFLQTASSITDRQGSYAA